MSQCPAIEALEGALAGNAEHAGALVHLETCSKCQKRAARVRENLAVLEQLINAAEPPAPSEPPSFMSDLLPGYEIVSEISRGGQGVVYQAIQKSTKRKVAVKVLREGPFADARDRARFEREVQILGQLNHPNILTILDSGAAHGHFYLVTKYISGQALDQYVEKRKEQGPKGPRGTAKEDVSETLRLFEKICEAVNAAHLRGVIHRDLKPGNIRIDHDGEPHVLDFGLAKLTVGPMTHESHPQVMTQTGQFMGSLPWASPEQAEGLPDKIDLRTDVYSLGVVLYQMLTGQFPYEVAGTFRAVLDNIQKTEPLRPRALNQWIDDEIETIVLKCLAKERERRYQSAGELARDIRHYLRGEPIAAKRDSAWYVLTKTLHRYRLPVALAGVAIGVLVVFAVALAFAYRQTARAEQDASRRAAEFAALLSKSNIERGQLLVAAANAPTAERLFWREFLTRDGDAPAARQAYWALWDLYARQPCLGRLPATGATPHSPQFLAGDTELAVYNTNGDWERWTLADFRRRAAVFCEAEVQSWKWAARADGLTGITCNGDKATLRDLAQGALLREVTWPGHTISCAAFSPDATRFALGSDDGRIRLYDAASGELQREIAAHPGPVRNLCFTPNAALLVSSGGDREDRTVRLWDAASGQLRQTHTFEAELRAAPDFLAVSRDGRSLAAGCGWIIQLFRLPDLKPARRLTGTAGGTLVFDFSPDGRQLAAGGLEKRVLVWNTLTGELVRTLSAHEAPITGVRFSANGRLLASTSADGTTRVWEVDFAGERAELPPGALKRISHPTPLFQIIFDYSGDEIFAAAEDGAVFSCDARTGARTNTYVGHTGVVAGLALAPNGQWLASGGHDGTLRLWDRHTAQPLAVVNVWEQRTDRPRESWKDVERRITSVAIGSDGHTLLCANHDGGITRWDRATLQCRGTIQTRSQRLVLDFSPDGRFFAAGGMLNDYWRDLRDINGVTAWDTPTEARIRFFAAGPHVVRALQFSPDGRRLAIGGDDAAIRIWDFFDTDSGFSPTVCSWILEGHTQPISAVRFSPDGRWLASAERGPDAAENQTGADGESCAILLWDANSGQNLLRLMRHHATIYSIAFSPDGRRLASCGRDGDILIHDLAYFERHIAGNLEAALRDTTRTLRQSATDAPIAESRIEQLRQWARRVLNVP